MAALGGIFMAKEAANFLVGMVADPWMRDYIRHVSQAVRPRNSRFGIVPDLHALNYPTGRQRVNDGGGVLSAEAIFEIKTMTACKTWYQHNNAETKPSTHLIKVCLFVGNEEVRSDELLRHAYTGILDR